MEDCESASAAPGADTSVSAGQADAAGRRRAAPPLAPGAMDKLMRLAALTLEAEEQRKLERDLGMIIELIDIMRAVDTTGVAPLAHPLEVEQPLRVDEVTEKPNRTRFQHAAPAVRDGLYLVPRVVE